jgi:hypothetical protein
LLVVLSIEVVPQLSLGKKEGNHQTPLNKMCVNYQTLNKSQSLANRIGDYSEWDINLRSVINLKRRTRWLGRDLESSQVPIY